MTKEEQSISIKKLWLRRFKYHYSKAINENQEKGYPNTTVWIDARTIADGASAAYVAYWLNKSVAEGILKKQTKKGSYSQYSLCTPFS